MYIDKAFLKQLFIYFFIGGFAALVNWIIFYISNSLCNIHYLIATIIAFFVATWVNWKLGRISLFKNSAVRSKVTGEKTLVYIVSAIGLLLNLLLMWLMVDILNIQPIIAIVITTGLVFFWNFFARRILIYKD